MRASERRAIERCVCEVWYVYAGWPVGAHRQRPGAPRTTLIGERERELCLLGKEIAKGTYKTKHAEAARLDYTTTEIDT